MMLHIESLKERTKNKPIEKLVDPPYIYIPLSRKFGDKPEPAVKVGDTVKRYQVVAKAIEGYAAPIHSPVSGWVSDIKECMQVSGEKVLTIIIKNDFLDTEIELPEGDPLNYSSDEILSIIEDAGIIGAGGAEFPTAKKYQLNGKDVRMFIINGAECEPYMTCDYAIMSQRTREFFTGIGYINKILQAEEVVIGIEENNRDLQELFAPYLEKYKYGKCRLQILPDAYPQGGELQLIESVTGIELANGRVPIEVGIVMSNVGTVYAVYEAVAKRIPMVERVLTVSGEQAEECGNFLIKIGTPVRDIIRAVGEPENGSWVIVGGPMMGKAINDLSVPVTKGSTGLLLLNREKFERLNCIWCGYCVEVCPMYLMPMKYEELYRKKKYKQLKTYSLESCIDCGSCEYICPSNVPLMESIQKGKNKLKEMSDATT